jgi:predicted membrane protein
MIEEAGKFILQIIFEVFFTWTGEIVLYVITFRKHKPRWDLYTKKSPSRFVIFSEVSLWIGIAFWIAAIAITCKIITKA